MAVAILSPWPSTPVALAAARTCLRDGIGAAGLSDDRTDAIGATAAAMVDAYASAAPQAVKNEATIRVAGWLKSSPQGELSALTAGAIRVEWRQSPASRNMLRQSGAMGLLSAWHRPRAIVLESS